LRILVAFLLFLLVCAAAHAERRVALVMGAGDYRTLRPLANAVNDARAIEKALRALDFEVSVETDRDLRRMRRAMEDFEYDAQGADVALIFFAGHGVEIGGVNRLLPVDADVSSLDALERTSLPLEEVRDTIARVAPVGLIVLDACRNDPFGAAAASGGRSASALQKRVAETVTPGLGRMGRSENALFAFSATPGQTASDGEGENSPFTAALAKYLGTEGLEIRSVLTLVQQEVYDRSSGAQLPYVESGLPALFFAATQKEELPERERLLLAMAKLTPGQRAEVERIATERGMPLAPLFAALISFGAQGADPDKRTDELRKSADAYVETTQTLRKLSSSDPEVQRLRDQAREQLSLGEFASARRTLAAAADVDRRSRQTLKQNLVARTLSEAATHYLSASAAHANVDWLAARADYDEALALYAEVDQAQMPPDDYQLCIDALRGSAWVEQQIQIFAQLQAELEETDASFKGTLVGKARPDIYKRLIGQAFDLSLARSNRDPGNRAWLADLALANRLLSSISKGDAEQEAIDRSLELWTSLVRMEPGNGEWQAGAAQTYSSLASAAESSGDFALARRHRNAAIEHMGRAIATDTGRTEWQERRAKYLWDLGGTEAGSGDLAAAAAAFQQSIGISLALAAQGVVSRTLAMEHDSLAHVFAELGDLDRAVVTLEEKIRLIENYPDLFKTPTSLVETYSELGEYHLEQRNFAEAERYYRLTVEAGREGLREDQDNNEWLALKVEEFLAKIVSLAKADGRIDAAASADRDRYAFWLRSGGRGAACAAAKWETWPPDWAGRSDSAIDLPPAVIYRRDIEIADALLAGDPENVCWLTYRTESQERLVQALRETGDTSGAGDVARNALRSLLASVGNSGLPPRLKELFVSLTEQTDELLRTAVLSAAGNGDLAQAISLTAERHALWIEAGGRDEECGSLLSARSGLQSPPPAWWESGGPLEAYRTNLGIAEALLARDPDNICWQVYRAESRRQIALLADPAMSMAQDEIGALRALAERFPSHPRFNEIAAELGMQVALRYRDLGRAGDALHAARAAVALQRQLAAERPKQSVPLARSHADLASLLAWAGRPEEAAGEYRRAIDGLATLYEAGQALSRKSKSEKDEEDEEFFTFGSSSDEFTAAMNVSTYKKDLALIRGDQKRIDVALSLMEESMSTLNLAAAIGNVYADSFCGVQIPYGKIAVEAGKVRLGRQQLEECLARLDKVPFELDTWDYQSVVQARVALADSGSRPAEHYATALRIAEDQAAEGAPWVAEEGWIETLRRKVGEVAPFRQR
jgi:uncharacterized caspase-like protein